MYITLHLMQINLMKKLESFLEKTANTISAVSAGWWLVDRCCVVDQSTMYWGRDVLLRHLLICKWKSTSKRGKKTSTPVISEYLTDVRLSLIQSIEFYYYYLLWEMYIYTYNVKAIAYHICTYTFTNINTHRYKHVQNGRRRSESLDGFSLSNNEQQRSQWRWQTEMTRFATRSKANRLWIKLNK